jgi:tritrans,polycis-undecaprenyl-diphosphate synthase [geranylgeranyl-diphosphate specific]
MENFERNKDEVEFLMNLFIRKIDDFSKDESLKKDQVRFRFLGRLNLFPKKIQEKIRILTQKTKEFDGFLCNIAMGYGGRSEIVDAAKRLYLDVKDDKIDIEDIDEKYFSKYLYMADEPDILIRTGGDKRISNFLLWQSNYSELFFMEKLWPEITKDDILSILNDYKRRERRFGK